MAATPANSLTLVSTGLADARLIATNGNPDIHQFVHVIHKTTRFSAQWNRVDFDGTPEFGQRVSLTIPTIAELVNAITIVVEMPDIYAPQLAAIQMANGTTNITSINPNNLGRFLGPLFGWTNSLGHALIQQIDLEIGGEIVETFDSRLLEVLDELNETVESASAKNFMIKRSPYGFKNTTYLTPTPTTVYVPIPFWFSKPGVHSHALPLQALANDDVRIHVTFRAINGLVYTDARANPLTIGLQNTPAFTPPFAPMLPITGSPFWQTNPASGPTGPVYTMNSSMGTTPVTGGLVPNVTMPLRFSPIDAYAMIEYISLEEYEALAFRTTELTYQVQQHFAVPVEQTLGQTEYHLDVAYSNPTKELIWVLQRPETATYNAYFLFTRDLYPTPVSQPVGGPPPPPNPTSIPWWPDAILLPTQENDWQLQPGFINSYSEPLAGAALHYNSYERFVHEGGSFFRSIIPSQYFVKEAAINRYIYAYAFGQKNDRLEYTPKGTANWDKIARKELYLTLNKSRGGGAPPNLNVYAYVTIWNIFKVYGGRGGMLFSN
jgi:Major capsid protein N-terminus/Large eukaryotic DNA virus major capsid protein